MFCIFKNDNVTKTAVLTFLRDELLNDLDQYGFVEGDVQRADADWLKHGKHQTHDITQDGNVDLVTRWLNLMLTWCREALFPYTKNPVMDNVTLDDTLRETETYTITMTVPDDFSDTTVEFLEELIHNLLVWYVLWRWLSITKQEGAEKWHEAVEDGKKELKGALARSCGYVYRRRSPFDSGFKR